MDLVDRFLPRSRRADAIESGVLAAARVWNATRPGTSGGERGAALRDAEALVGEFIQSRGRAKRAVEAMARRLRREHADLTRRIIDVRFSEGDAGRLQIHVVSTAGPGPEGDDVDPRIGQVEQRMAAALEGEMAASPVARRHALQALGLLADMHPDALERHSVDVWAAAALHAAFQHLPEPRLTTAELAARFSVRGPAVGDASRRLRRLVEWHWLHAADPLSRLKDSLEHRTWRGERAGASRDEAEAVFRASARGARLQRDGAFRFQRFVRGHRIPDRQADLLWHSFLIGMRDAVHRRLRKGGAARIDANPLRDEPIVADPSTLCISFAAALRDSSLSAATRVAVARYLVALFPYGLDPAIPEPLRTLPQSGLLPILVLARTGELAGPELVSAISFACAYRETLDNLLVSEIVELAAAVAAAESVAAAGRIDALARILSATAAIRDAAAMAACIDGIANCAEIPLQLRCAALDSLLPRAPGDAVASPRFTLAAGARSSVALARARLEGDPITAVRRLLDLASMSGDAAFEGAAADLLREEADGIGPEVLRPLIRRGIESGRAAVRRSFHEIGLRCLGPEALDWARQDRAAAVRAWADAKTQHRPGEDGAPADRKALEPNVIRSAPPTQLGMFDG